MLILALLAGVPVAMWLFIRRTTTGFIIEGKDFDTGKKQRRRFHATNEHGGVTWKRRGGDHCHIVMDEAFRWTGDKVPEYEADVTRGRGWLIKTERDAVLDSCEDPEMCAGMATLIRAPHTYRQKSMDGFRLWAALFGGGLREIADSAKSNVEKMVTVIAIVGLVAVLGIGGMLVYLVQKMQDVGVA